MLNEGFISDESTISRIQQRLAFFLSWRKIDDLFQEYNQGRSFSSSLESFLLQTDFSTYVWLFFVINEGYLSDEW